LAELVDAAADRDFQTDIQGEELKEEMEMLWKEAKKHVSDLYESRITFLYANTIELLKDLREKIAGVTSDDSLEAAKVRGAINHLSGK